MTKQEHRAILSLSSIMALRMIGLFMVLPLFSLYAMQLKGATPTLVGVGMGIYGLSQVLLQTPFGALSDRYGRKPLIIIGLLIFCAGSVIAGLADSISWLIIGRTIQGMGVVGSTILAMLADLTREEHRAKAMAISGITIGFAFMLAILLGPVLAEWFSVADIFYLAAAFGLGGLFILYHYVPTPHYPPHHALGLEAEYISTLRLLLDPELNKLNCGILILHAIFTASFVVIPINLLQIMHLPANRQWIMYLPALIISAIVALILVSVAERKQQIKPYLIGGIALLALSELLLWQMPTHSTLMFISLCCFFASFSLLEAFLPSLVSRAAPAARKGSALGLYSSSQFLGIFVGGVLGGWLYGHYHFFGVYLFCVILALIWFILALFMQPPRLKEQPMEQTI